MNLCGSDVAKDAADMIIMNDDFGSIVNAVTKKHVVA
jgi:magnesium-transporting ATPase (P-type)